MAGFMNSELEAIRNNLECGHCTAKFKGTDSQARKVKYEKANVYCSAICRSASTINRLTKPVPNRGPCKTCGKEFFSRSPKIYCTIKCYTASDQFRAMQLENSKKNQAPEIRRKISNTLRTGEVSECLECAGDVYSQRGRHRKFCSTGCYRSYLAKRFDRWVANPEGLALPQCYDEFLDSEELQCMVDGCGWVGKHLTMHVNQAHGIIAPEFKRAAGFNLSTGIISRSLAETLRGRENVGVAIAPNGNALKMARDAQAISGNRYRSKEADEHHKKSRALAGVGPLRFCGGCGGAFKQSTPYGKALYCSRKCRNEVYAQKQREIAGPRKQKERNPDGTFKWVIQSDNQSKRVTRMHSCIDDYEGI